MNNRFYYNCYNFLLKSNVPLDLLHFCDEINLKNHTVSLTGCEDKTPVAENIYFKEEKNEFIIESPYASYVITGDQITAHYKNKKALEATLFNLPFSVVARNHGDILLHAGSVAYGNSIMAFCANKGVGKTTFVSHLSRKINYFSDDTLYLTKESGQVICFSNEVPLKMKQDTFNSLSNAQEIFVNARNSLMGKKYIEKETVRLIYSKSHEIYFLKKIFFLRRKKIKNINVIKIESKLQKKCLLLSNIVGISYFTYAHIKVIENSPLFTYIVQNISFYYLDVCDDLSEVGCVTNLFYEYINSNNI